LRRFYERVAGRVGKIDAKEDENWYLTTATTLGRRTGEMHLALARASGPAFAPEPLDSGALRALRATAAEPRRPLEQRLHAEHAGRAQAGSRAGRAACRPHDGAPGAGGRIRIHGDYHLGQVLARKKTSLSWISRVSRRADRRAAREAVAAQGCRGHDALLQLRGMPRCSPSPSTSPTRSRRSNPGRIPGSTGPPTRFLRL
jgi:hypothetical protein